MPLLSDVPTRSRKLLEDLGSSPIGPGGQQRATYGQYGVPRASPKRVHVRASGFFKIPLCYLARYITLDVIFSSRSPFYHHLSQKLWVPSLFLLLLIIREPRA